MADELIVTSEEKSRNGKKECHSTLRICLYPPWLMNAKELGTAINRRSFTKIEKVIKFGTRFTVTRYEWSGRCTHTFQL